MKKFILALMLVMIMCTTSYANSMVQRISDCARLIQNVQRGEVTGIIGSLVDVTSGSQNKVHSNLNNALSVANVGTSLNSSLTISGITLDNVAAIYGTTDDLLRRLTKGW